jgi:hypothetical protein
MVGNNKMLQIFNLGIDFDDRGRYDHHQIEMHARTASLRPSSSTSSPFASKEPHS